MYPIVRRRAVNELVTEKETIIEVNTLTFDDASSVTYTFQQLYPEIPHVTAISKDVSINVFIESISTTSVTLGTSAITDGPIHIHVIYIGE